MKKFFMLLAVVALSVSYSFAQNSNSGVTVSKNGGQFVLIDDCGAVFFATSSNQVTMANGFLKYTGIFDISESCEQYDKATKFTAPNVTINVTPSGVATLKVIVNPKKP